MTNQRNTRSSLLAAIILGISTLAFTAQAEFSEIADLTISGWVDFVYTNAQSDAPSGGPADPNPGDKNDLGLSEVELNFLLDFGGGLSGQIDIDYEDGQTHDIELERAFLTYTLDDGESPVSIELGRVLSWMGSESADVVNLHQVSYSLGSAIIPEYQDGLRLNYQGEGFSLGGAILDGVFDTDNDADDLGYELQATIDTVENVTLFLGYASEENDAAGGDDPTLFNVWASLQATEDVLVVLEWIDASDHNDGTTVADRESYSAMVNVSVSDVLGFTGRFSNLDVDNGAESDEYSIAAIYEVHEHLELLLEYRNDSVDGVADTDTIALEALLTF